MPKILRIILSNYKYYIFLMFLAPIAGAFSPILLNHSLKNIIDLFKKNDYITYSIALYPILQYLIANLMNELTWRIYNFSQLKSMPYILDDVFQYTVKHILNLPYSVFQNTPSGSITSRAKGIRDNIFKLQNRIGDFTDFFKVIFCCITLIKTHISLTVFIIAFLGINIPMMIHYMKQTASFEEQDQVNYHYMIGYLGDCISNIANIFNFGRKNYEISFLKKHGREKNVKILKNFYKFDFIYSTYFALIFTIFTVSIFIYTIHLKNKQKISEGEIILIISTAIMLFESTWIFAMRLQMLIKDYQSFKTSCEILDMPLNKELQSKFKLTKGEIEFKNISFSYDKKTQKTKLDDSSIKNKNTLKNSNIFENFSLHIKPNTSIGIIGKSGSGKSTLINLLTKRFNVDRGEILIDGQNIDCTSQEILMQNISIISQNCTMFHRTIRENIMYSNPEATEQELIKACKIANIYDFIVSKADGFETAVGENGLKLSGGQIQRIAIARAVLKKSKIMILDEATSALDSETESEIQKSLDNLMHLNSTTTICIAHRISTLKNFNEIITIEDGRVISHTHKNPF